MDLTAPLHKNYTLPENTRVYAIGDIHGYYDALAKMHAAIDQHIYKNPHENVTIVYLGDYVDRGPESAKVIERLAEMQNSNDPITRIFLRGNHEQALLNFLKDPLATGHNWLKFGGIQTLESYGIEVGKLPILPGEMERLARELQQRLPEHHEEFLHALRMYHKTGDYLFVHAGIRPGIELSEQLDMELMSIREPFLDSDKEHGYRVVHGHSITFDPEIKSNRIGIDTGYYETGTLTAAVIEGEEVDILQVKGDIEVS